MKIIKINPQRPNKKDIDQAISVMADGGIVLYPTDTIYGLGANIFNENALKRIYVLKKRSKEKPLSVCVSNIKKIPQIADMDDKYKDKIGQLLPGPFTIILKKRNRISSILTAGGKNIGVRIPDHIICQKLSEKFPITASSANISGMSVKNTIPEILDQLGSEVDLVLDIGSLENLKPSTVVDFTCDPPKILRDGAGYFKWP